MYKAFRKLSELRAVIRESVANEVAKFYREPIQTLSREEMYYLGTSIVNRASNRLCVYQKSPSLLLGARDYAAGDNNKLLYEQKLFDAIEGWVDAHWNNPDKEMLYLFSRDPTLQELGKRAPEPLLTAGLF